MERREQDWDGPYLQSAFFCERLLQEADGVISAIRIIDRLVVRASDRSPESVMPAAPIDLTLFISFKFKTGHARGMHDLTVALEGPSGALLASPGQHFSQTIILEGAEGGGNNVIIPIGMHAEQDGVYWFGVYLDDRLITKVPLRVETSRQQQGVGYP